MPETTASGRELVNAFPIDDAVLVKHYFDGEAVFERLRPYYNESQYRFEVDVADFDSLRRFLREHGYDLRVVRAPEAYWVAVERYTDHPDDIFRRSVYQERAEGYNCFLLKDRAAVERALEDGATRLGATPFSLSTATLSEFAAAPA